MGDTELTRTAPEGRPDLLALTPEELDESLARFFSSLGEPEYRIRQVRRWIYQSSVPSFDRMTNLPDALRLRLAGAFLLPRLEISTLRKSSDGTTKHLWELEDGSLVESVLIPEGDRLTLCISSQVGCPVGCTFCATGWAGFTRQLTAGEIVAQYRGSLGWAMEHGPGPITNVVYMGMGEPLANLRAVHTSLTVLNRGFRLGARRITVSTVGITPGILELARRTEQFGLALSLHAPRSDLRLKLIPIEKRHPLPELMEAISEFREIKGRRVTFEYTMIRGINDARELAPELADVARSVRAFVNLIPYNPIPYQDWETSDPSTIAFFRRTLEQAGVPVAVRQPRGRDIEAACGQLRATAGRREEAPA